MLSIIAAVAFATILAVVAGLTLASSSSLAHDLYANVIKRGKVTGEQEVKVGRISAVVIGAERRALDDLALGTVVVSRRWRRGAVAP